MATVYDKHIFKQLEDVLKKCNNLSQEIKDIKQHQIEIYEINQKYKKQIDKLKHPTHSYIANKKEVLVFLITKINFKAK